MLRKAQKYGAEGGTIFLGEGTVQSKLLEKIGLNKTHKEIASILKISENTSASQFHRAKALLVKEIELYRLKIKHYERSMAR